MQPILWKRPCRCWQTILPLRLLILFFYTYNDTTVKRLEDLATRWRDYHAAMRTIPNCPKHPKRQITRPRKNTKKPKGTSSRSRKITRLNARDILRRSEEGEISLYVLIGTKTSFSVMWRTPQRIRQTARYRQRRKNLLRLRNWKSRTSAIRKLP